MIFAGRKFGGAASIGRWFGYKTPGRINRGGQIVLSGECQASICPISSFMNLAAIRQVSMIRAGPLPGLACKRSGHPKEFPEGRQIGVSSLVAMLSATHFFGFFDDTGIGFQFRLGEPGDNFSGCLQVKFVVLFKTGFPFKSQFHEHCSPSGLQCWPVHHSVRSMDCRCGPGPRQTSHPWIGPGKAAVPKGPGSGPAVRWSVSSPFSSILWPTLWSKRSPHTGSPSVQPRGSRSLKRLKGLDHGGHFHAVVGGVSVTAGQFSNWSVRMFLDHRPVSAGSRIADGAAVRVHHNGPFGPVPV